VRKFTITAIAVMALAITGVASAALVPGVYDPDHTGCPTATYTSPWLHLAKNCATSTNAAAGADITGVTGTFTSASFTLASTTQCQGGSPRFDIVTTVKTYFLGCNNVIPVVNARRHRDLHVHRCDDRGGRQPGRGPDRHHHVG
jgi:hypothetical protein